MNTKLYVIASVLFAAATASAEDRGYRYNPDTEQCEKNGHEGFNPGLVGECGDLSGMYLYGADLRGKNLRGVVLNRTDLAHADLSGADLRGAHVISAYLLRANLSDADLRDVVFESHATEISVLYRVNVSGAIFDCCSVLPFSPQVAIARRMILKEHEKAPSAA